MFGLHRQEDYFPWTIDVVDRPLRKDSPDYVASRNLLQKTIAGPRH